MLNIFSAPGRYIQGADATAYLPKELKRLGMSGCALMVTSATPRRQLEALWRETFLLQGLNIEIYDFGGESSLDEVAKIKRQAEDHKVSVIIGAGGGKILDAVRASAERLNLPVICCPTTAASDAPCSTVSVIYTPQGVFESCLLSRRNPDLVLVDTKVILKAPLRGLIAGMGDALATYFEADACSRAGKLNILGGSSTLCAQMIAQLCYTTLLEDGKTALEDARRGLLSPSFDRIVEANTLMSGLGFESGGLALAHSLHNGLTAMKETHAFMHGEKVAFGALVQLILEARDNNILSEVLSFCFSVGLPMTLADIGLAKLTREQAENIAQLTLAPHESAHNEPFPLNSKQIVDAIFAADAQGRAFKSGAASVGA
ncbi:MAG: glycerol dehydrogenase [Methylocystaceae bacterium]|nr:glycerol dehydrogenase [Methylocystaceae bacterium]